MKICKNGGFRHISSIFGRKKIFFENRALPQFMYYYFASVCKFSWKNIKYSLRNSRNTVFFNENWLFRRLLEGSGFKIQVFWKLKHAWWWVLLLIMFLCEKTTKYEETSDTFMDLPCNQGNNEDLIEKWSQIRREYQEISKN